MIRIYIADTVAIFFIVKGVCVIDKISGFMWNLFMIIPWKDLHNGSVIICCTTCNILWNWIDIFQMI